MNAAGSTHNWLLVLIIALVPATIAAEVQAATNLAYDTQYQCTTEILPGWTGLTDGVKDSDQPPACFATDNSAHFPKEIIIDLDRVYRVTKIAVYNSLNGNTRHIGVSISRDLENFEPLREYYFPPNQVQPLIHSFALRPARYVKITLYDTWRRGLKGDNCLFLREVEVYGEEAPGIESTQSVRDILRLAALQPAVVAPHSVQLFRRYCLQGQPRILIGVLGDSLAVSDQGAQVHWVDSFVEQLKEQDDSPQLEVRNLASLRQDPHKGAQLLAQLLEPETVDLLIIAYGTDAALAEVSPDRFRREFEYLLREAFHKLPALIVIVTPPPRADLSNLHIAQITEDIASLTGAAVVRTDSVLGRQLDNIPRLYQDNLTLSSEAHQALAAALLELLGYSRTSD